MSADLRSFVSLIQNSITWTPRKLLSSFEYYFWKEYVKIGSQSYQTFELNRLIKTSLFGHDERELRINEVIKNKFHIACPYCVWDENEIFIHDIRFVWEWIQN
jgi:hypothetical protein